MSTLQSRVLELAARHTQLWANLSMLASAPDELAAARTWMNAAQTKLGTSRYMLTQAQSQVANAQRNLDAARPSALHRASASIVGRGAALRAQEAGAEQ
jgi:hypothetical protein